MARCAMFIDKNIDKAKSIAEEILDKNRFRLLLSKCRDNDSADEN